MHRLFTRLGLWLGAIALIIGLLLYQIFYPQTIITKTINLHHDRDRALVGRLYLPNQTAPLYLENKATRRTLGRKYRFVAREPDILEKSVANQFHQGA